MKGYMQLRQQLPSLSRSSLEDISTDSAAPSRRVHPNTHVQLEERLLSFGTSGIQVPH